MRWLLGACMTWLAIPASADVYAALDARGRLEVSHYRQDPRFTLFAPGHPVSPGPELPHRAAGPDKNLSRLIVSVAREHHVDARLIHAVVHVESAFNARAVSAKGALGLMQIMPRTGSSLGAGNLLEPAQNLRAGAMHLGRLIRHFHGDVVLALAAYNAGEAAVRKYGNRVPPYQETRHYVERVLARYRDAPLLDAYVRGSSPEDGVVGGILPAP
jgi:soluble lytic murein transglycosylase-like protein